MKLCFVLVVAALLSWCAVGARPQPGTTRGKGTDDLDGIGDDLDAFLKHKDQTNPRLTETQNVYGGNRNMKPASSGTDLIGGLLNGFRGGQGGSQSSGLGSLATAFGGLSRPSNPPTSVQYPAMQPSASAAAPARPAYNPSAQYPSRPSLNVPSYPTYPSGGAGMGSQSQVPVGGGWVSPGSSAPKQQQGGATYPAYQPSSYPARQPSYPAYQPSYPAYQPAYQQPSYTNYQRGSPSAYPSSLNTYPGYQSVQRYDPRSPPPPQKKSSSGGISGFFKKIFS